MPMEDNNKANRIEVILPVYHPGPELLRLLEALMAQDTPPAFIHLLETVEEGAGEGEAIDYARRYPNRVDHHRIPKAEFDHAGTRNFGASLCPQADHLLFMTQDAVPENALLLTELLKGFALGEPQKIPVAAAYARQLPKADAKAAVRITQALNYPEESRLQTIRDLPERGIRSYYLSDVCALYDAEVFRKLGGFDAPAVFNEDMVYAASALKAGYGVAYCAKAKVRHSHNYGAIKQLHRNFDLGASQAQHPEVFGGISSESTGVRYVKNVLGELRRTGNGRACPGFILTCAARFIGYRLGKAYRKLPRAFVRRLSDQPDSAGYRNGT